MTVPFLIIPVNSSMSKSWDSTNWMKIHPYYCKTMPALKQCCNIRLSFVKRVQECRWQATVIIKRCIRIHFFIKTLYILQNLFLSSVCLSSVVLGLLLCIYLRNRPCLSLASMWSRDCPKTLATLELRGGCD